MFEINDDDDNNHDDDDNNGLQIMGILSAHLVSLTAQVN